MKSRERDIITGGYERVIGEGNGTPLHYSGLGNPMDGGAWWAAVHGVAKSWTWLSDFTFTFHFHALEKEMATHSGVLAWRIPGTAEPGGLPSMGSHRVRHNWSNLAAVAAAWDSDILKMECSVNEKAKGSISQTFLTITLRKKNLTPQFCMPIKYV